MGSTSVRVIAALVTGASVLVLCGNAIAQTGSARTATQADFDLCNREAQIGGSASGASVGAGAAAGGTTSGGSTLESGTSAAFGDTQLRGMASAGAASATYQQMYRDCMRRRGF
jgi:hypothetical protein